MKVTGRLQNSNRTTSARGTFLATQSGEDVARAVHVYKLREQVLTGRYRPDPERLAREILRRALSRTHTA